MVRATVKELASHLATESIVAIMFDIVIRVRPSYPWIRGATRNARSNSVYAALMWLTYK